MASWMLIIIGLAVLFVFFKTRDAKYRIMTFILLAIFIFIFFSFQKMTDNPETDLTSFTGIISSVKIYFASIKQNFAGAVSTTGNTLKLDWITNSTQPKN